jgi:4'-phosphopantetheinyl transferase
VLNPGEVHVWRVPIEGASHEAARAALRAILARYTAVPIEIARREKGKPWLPGAPDVRFNLSHTRGIALVAVARAVEVGVDVEKMRPVPEFAALAERFFPPSEAAPGDEAGFFRAWTRIEAVLKARGVGLLEVGSDPKGRWGVREIDLGEGYAAAVAAEDGEFVLRMFDYGDADEDRGVGWLLSESG